MRQPTLVLCTLTAFMLAKLRNCAVASRNLDPLSTAGKHLYNRRTATD